jgi:hypothetical protein
MGKSNKEFNIFGIIFHIYEGICGMYIKEGKASSGRKGKTWFHWKK